MKGTWRMSGWKNLGVSESLKSETEQVLRESEQADIVYAVW